MIFFQAPIVDARDFLKEIEARYSEGKIDEALEVARVLLWRHMPIVWEHTVFWGRFTQRPGQLDDAIAAFQKVVEIKTGFCSRIIAIWRWCSLGRGKISQALSALGQGDWAKRRTRFASGRARISQ